HLGFLNPNEFRHAPEYEKEYLVKANWALYVENYLEGFHIPFVHNQSFGNMLDAQNYTTLLYEHASVQVGYANESDYCFNLPEGHPEHGKRVAAYYYWLFPNIMFNVYPYGIQVNVVKPLTKNSCKVHFIFYIKDQEIFEAMDAAALAAKVEREDEFVVEGVQKGLQSRFYKNGRFSPRHETGVHHFQQLVQQFFSE
ncbi:MAG: SRPBCC family protein, partial [Bacteroidota bacterium]